MALTLQDGKIRTEAQKDAVWNKQDGKLRSLSEKNAAAGVSIPVLDEGMLVGGLQPLAGGLI